jgi:autophagy-related protein 2
VALLHLKLPPEIHLATARASLFRITFVLELGVPRIIIEVDGIQIRARLVEHTDTVSKSRGTERTSPRARSPSLHRLSSPPADDPSGSVYDDDDDYIPTVRDLADSFLREEPEEEIKELEQELESQSAYLQESVLSSEDDDEESIAGMGVPIALPYYLRGILNTALDRLQIVVNDIDIEVQDQIPPLSPVGEDESSYTSLNFHVDRIAIDSVTAEEPRDDVSPPKDPQDTSKLGKRRLRIENVCGRLISDARNFVLASRTSVPSSPVDTRSEMTSSVKTQSDVVASEVRDNPEASAQFQEAGSPLSASKEAQMTASVTASQPATVPTDVPPSQSPQHSLSSSLHTPDEDRFADADSDDGLERSFVSHSSSRSGPHDLGTSSRFYDEDERLLKYLQNNLLDSQLGTSQIQDLSESRVSNDRWNLDIAGSGHEEAQSFYESQSSSYNLPTVSVLGQSIELTQESELSRGTVSPSQSTSSQRPNPEADLHDSRQLIEDQTHDPVLSHSLASSTHSQASLPEDLTESSTSSHEDAASMYMSAMSAPPEHGHVPGSWDSSPASSHGTSSDTSAEIPEDMIAGSILCPQPHDRAARRAYPLPPNKLVVRPLHLQMCRTQAKKPLGSCWPKFF